MEKLKLCAILTALAMLAGTANAITYSEAYSGPVKWKLTNWDMGTIYYGENGGDLQVNHLYDTAATLNGLDQIAAPGAIGTEDSWGIFVVTDIYKDDGTNDLLWSDGDNGRQLAGIFYGGIDNGLYVSGADLQQTIQSSGLKFKVFEQPAGTLTPALEELGSKGRDGVNMDQYAGVGYSWSDTVIVNGQVDPGELTPIGSAIEVIDGVTTAGVAKLIGSTEPANERALFTPTGSTGSGEKTFYVDVTGGTWQYGPPFQYEAADFLFPSSQFGDMFVDSSAQANPNKTGQDPFGDWTVLSEDPVRADATIVPEPVTMIALAGSLIGLGGYIRRRSRV